MSEAPDGTVRIERSVQRQIDVEDLASGKATPKELKKRTPWIDEEAAANATFDRKSIAYGDADSKPSGQ